MYLVYLSPYIAGGVSAIIVQVALLVSVVSIKLSGLKLIQGFRPNEHFFKIFTCASLETSLIL